MTGGTVDNYRTEQEGRQAFGLSLLSIILVAAVGLLSWWFFRNELLYNMKFRFGFPIWMFCTGITLFAMLLLNSFKWMCMHFSPQFIADNIHSSISLPDDQPRRYGWRFIKLGSTKYPVPNNIYWYGTAIIPDACAQNCGENLGTKVQLTITPYNELPTLVKEGIHAFALKPPFYYGVLSEKQFLEDVDLLKPEMSEDMKERILSKVGKYKDISASALAYMFGQQSRMHEHDRKDKNILMDDMGHKSDLVTQIDQKPKQFERIRRDVAGKKEDGK